MNHHLDQFAAAAISGIMSRGGITAIDAAREAYAVADSMMAESDRRYANEIVEESVKEAAEYGATPMRIDVDMARDYSALIVAFNGRLGLGMTDQDVADLSDALQALNYVSGVA